MDTDNNKETPAPQILTEAKAITATMQVGNEVLVQKELSAERHWANFIGWIPGEFLFLDGPRQLVKMGFLFKGNVILVRYLYLGTMYGFTSKVYDLIGYPLMVLVEWPAKVEVMRPSSEPRAAANLEAHLFVLRPDGQHLKFPATLRDLSCSGCKLLVPRDKKSENRFSSGVQTAIQVQIPGQEKPLTLRAEVRNVLKQKDDIVLGLRFSEDQPDKRAIIASIMERQLLMG